MTISLPCLPPSVNQIFYTDFAHKTRHKSKAYKDFIKRCEQQMFGLGTFGDDVEVEYNFYFPDKRRRDMANLEKALSDTLVYYKIIKDDSQIKRMVLESSYEKGNAQTVIEIKPYVKQTPFHLT